MSGIDFNWQHILGFTAKYDPWYGLLGCSRPFCQYEHICYRYINVPGNAGIPEKYHKAISCPNKERRPSMCTHYMASKWLGSTYVSSF